MHKQKRTNKHNQQHNKTKQNYKKEETRQTNKNTNAKHFFQQKRTTPPKSKQQ